MKRKLSLEFGRYSGQAEGCHLVVTDHASHVRMIDIQMSLADAMRFITSCHITVDGTVANRLDLVGMSAENKTIAVDVPDVRWNATKDEQADAVRKACAVHEEDGWEADVDMYLGSQRTSGVVFRRHVPDETARDGVAG